MRWPTVPCAAAAGLVLARLPFLGLAPGPDEGGYLTVAAQWHAGGSSLYGSYWVDRPPLLLTIYQLAAALGGVVPLRLLGCLAAALTVLGVASAVRRAAGERPAAVAAVVAAALLVSPLMGALPVDGELLAAPFIAGGMACAVRAVTLARCTRRPWAALGTGACAAAAVLVKQNLADVVVFAAACWLVALGQGVLTGRGLFRAVSAATLGALAVAAAVGGWAVLHGTSLRGVAFAMYPFRLEAAGVIAGAPGDAAVDRLSRLGAFFAASTLPVLLVVFVVLLLRRRLHGPVAWALLASTGFAIASAASGGGYWTHYLVETVPALAMVAGLVASVRTRASTVATATATAVAVLAWCVAAAMTVSAAGTVIGVAVRATARPGDTIVSAFGDADVVYASGLRSPYPYLWSLPSRTLDPRLRLLRTVLAGRAAPTWLVVRGRGTLARLQAGLGPVLSRDYRAVAEVCGRTVYLRRGDRRAHPHPSSCRARDRSGTRQQPGASLAPWPSEHEHAP